MFIIWNVKCLTHPFFNLFCLELRYQGTIRNITTSRPRNKDRESNALQSPIKEYFIDGFDKRHVSVLWTFSSFLLRLHILQTCTIFWIKLRYQITVKNFWFGAYGWQHLNLPHLRSKQSFQCLEPCSVAGFVVYNPHIPGLRIVIDVKKILKSRNSVWI